MKRRFEARLRDLDERSLPSWVQALNFALIKDDCDPDRFVDVLYRLAARAAGPMSEWVKELEVDDVVKFSKEDDCEWIDQLADAWRVRVESGRAVAAESLREEIAIAFEVRRMRRAGGEEPVPFSFREHEFAMRTDGDNMTAIRSKHRARKNPTKRDEDRQVRRFERPVEVTYRKAA